MTTLDLVCEPPYMIALMGVISFASFAIGSLLLAGLADKCGRRPILIGISVLTPICLFILIIAGNGMPVIYSTIFVLGLTYTTRSATAYLLGTEFLCSKDHISFGKANYILSGLIKIGSGAFFYCFKS